jgi:hypothetical protein
MSLCSEIRQIVWKRGCLKEICSKPRENFMFACEIEDSKGGYVFYENTCSVLRCLESYFEGNVGIEINNLERYQRAIKNKQELGIPIKITSDNIDTLKAQKNIVLMFKKYINFLENYKI